MANISKFDNANALYHALVDTLKADVDALIPSRPHPTFALSTGNTMIPFYHMISDREANLQVSKWICFNLDEYYPVNNDNNRFSFAEYMNTHFYGRLKGGSPRRCMLNGKAIDPAQECANYEKEIHAAGGIDIAILGIGTNGHIAFNEPGSEFDSRTRQVTLHTDTLLANFSGKAVYTHSLTMGIGTILEAKRIYVVALGKNKANAVRAAILDPPSRTLPASGLQKHSNVTWFLDQDASQLLS